MRKICRVLDNESPLRQRQSKPRKRSVSTSDGMAKTCQHQKADPVKDETDKKCCHKYYVSAQQSIITTNFSVAWLNGNKRHFILLVWHGCPHRVMNWGRGWRIKHLWNWKFIVQNLFHLKWDISTLITDNATATESSPEPPHKWAIFREHSRHSHLSAAAERSVVDCSRRDCKPAVPINRALVVGNLGCWALLFPYLIVF